MAAIDASAVAAIAQSTEQQLRNMQQWDEVPWERAMECPTGIRNCPKRWEASIIDAKIIVLRAIKRLSETGQGHSVESERHWKLLSMLDALMLSDIHMSTHATAKDDKEHMLPMLYTLRGFELSGLVHGCSCLLIWMRHNSTQRQSQ